jgi:hypothetical protein
MNRIRTSKGVRLSAKRTVDLNDHADEIANPTLKPKHDINIRHDRHLGVARITRLKGGRRHGAYHFCDEQEIERGDCDLINAWMRKNRAIPVIKRRTPKGRRGVLLHA